MLRTHTIGWRKLDRQFAGVRQKALPRAAANVLNEQAFTTRKTWRVEMASSFIIRNKWTQGSLRVRKARPSSNLVAIQSVVGSVADYMLDAEEGAKHSKHGKHGMAIPTGPGAGMAQGSNPRTKAVTKRLRSIPIARRPRGLSRRRAMVAAVHMARRSGKKAAYLETPKGTRGIFRIMGTKKKPKIRMLWDLTRSGVTQPPTPTMVPAVAAMFRIRRGRMTTTFGRALRWGAL